MSQLVRPKMKTDSLMHIFSPICNRLIRRLAEKCGYKLFCQLHSQKETENVFFSYKKNMINVSIDENTGPQSIMLNSTSVWMPQGTVLKWW